MADEGGVHTRRRRIERRAWMAGLVLSGLVHAGVFALAWRPVDILSSAGGTPPTRISEWGIRVVRLPPEGEQSAAPRAPTDEVRELAPVAPAVKPTRTAPPESLPTTTRSAPTGAALHSPPWPAGRMSAAARLRPASRDARLLLPVRPPPPRRAELRDRTARAIEAMRAATRVGGLDSLSYTRWGDPGSEIGLSPGAVTIAGLRIPFCGGTDVARCGFGARPWDLERADRERALQRGLAEQQTWATIQERARAIRVRDAGRRDTIR